MTRSKLLNFATTVSALMCAAAVYVGWVRGGRVYDRALTTEEQNELVMLELLGTPSNSPGISGFSHTWRPFPGVYASDYMHGVSFRTYYLSRPGLAGAALVTAVLPAVWLCRRVRPGCLAARERAAAVAGVCPACGYDLRATPGRCPECGRAKAGESGASGRAPQAGRLQDGSGAD